MISTLQKLEISTLLKFAISSFSRVKISTFRSVEVSKQTNAKADDSNLNLTIYGRISLRVWVVQVKKSIGTLVFIKYIKSIFTFGW